MTSRKTLKMKIRDRMTKTGESYTAARTQLLRTPQVGCKPLLVTFDRNTIEKAVRPKRFPKDPRQNDYYAVHQALSVKRILGFFSETLLTLEGIACDDRPEVFGGTALKSTEEVVEEGNKTHINLELEVRQDNRKSFHPEDVARFSAAFQMGFRMLSIPRIGALKINDPDGKLYIVQEGEELGHRIDKEFEVIREIEARGLGMAQAKEIGHILAQRTGRRDPWYKLLDEVKDIHERRAVARAIAEWSDADSIAAHIAYGNDVFCTEDQGHSAGQSSILDGTNRRWLEQTYGVRFATLSELLSHCHSMP